MIDGAQSFGSKAVDLRAIGCDFYSGSAHKWFMGPREMGILYVRKELVTELWPHLVGAGYDGHQLDDIERLSTLGQVDNAKLAAFTKAVEFHQMIGAEKIEQRIRTLANQLKEQVQNNFPQARLVTPVTEEMSAGVVIVQFPGQDHATLFKELYDQHQVACAPTGGLRLSPTIYNSPREITKVISAIDKLITRG